MEKNLYNSLVSDGEWGSGVMPQPPEAREYGTRSMEVEMDPSEIGDFWGFVTTIWQFLTILVKILYKNICNLLIVTSEILNAEKNSENQKRLKWSRKTSNIPKVFQPPISHLTCLCLCHYNVRINLRRKLKSWSKFKKQTILFVATTKLFNIFILRNPAEMCAAQATIVEMVYGETWGRPHKFGTAANTQSGCCGFCLPKVQCIPMVNTQNLLNAKFQILRPFIGST